MLRDKLRVVQGKKFRELRKQKGLTILQMAVIMQTSETRVVRIESGKYEIYLNEAMLFKKELKIDLIKELDSI